MHLLDKQNGLRYQVLFAKINNPKLVSFCIKQANGVPKIILIQRLNKIIFLASLADIFACFKQKLTTFLYIFTVILPLKHIHLNSRIFRCSY